MLAKQGMRTVQYTSIPDAPASEDGEADVIALRSRSMPPADAAAQSLAALDWLKARGCSQFFLKYCSTFDSTPDGNFGPVAQALSEALDAHKVIVCPAFSGAGRSVYQGHQFVGDALLNESGMQNHPLTPMTDDDIRRWHAPQTSFSVARIPSVAGYLPDLQPSLKPSSRRINAGTGSSSSMPSAMPTSWTLGKPPPTCG